MTIKPVAQKPRLIPFHLRNELESEINKRVDQDIWEPVFGQATEWVSNLVLFFKPNSRELRVCTDYRDVNRAIKRERHLLPTLEEIVQQIQDAEFFAMLDCNSAFEQVELDDESLSITTISSHLGLFQSKRLNLGICSAPEIFHNLMRKILFGLKGVVNAHDDILIYGKTLSTLQFNVDSLLKRLVSAGLTLNLKKCQFNREKVDYFELTFSKAGVKLKELKTEALRSSDQTIHLNFTAF